MSQEHDSSAPSTTASEQTPQQETERGERTQPSFIAYQVRETEKGATYFNRVGSAFAHKDGEGHTLTLDSMPVDGRVTLRTPKERLQALQSDEAGQKRQRSEEQSR